MLFDVNDELLHHRRDARVFRHRLTWRRLPNLLDGGWIERRRDGVISRNVDLPTLAAFGGDRP